VLFWLIGVAVLVACAVVAVTIVATPAFARVSAHDAGVVGPAADVPAPVIHWRTSRAVGLPWHGRLVHGVQLPAEGPDWFTWDPVLNRRPDRGWRRWGTDVLVHRLLHVASSYRQANPGAPRLGIGDLSRRHGGPFGREFGGLGHNSHQNGLDADIWYPRRDGTERRPRTVGDVDRRLAQSLVDHLLDAGAQKLFVGPHLGLRGPRAVVIPLAFHDDHVHLRIAPPSRR
jgi:murein endopeptidase